MTGAAILLSVVPFICWEIVLFAAGIRLARAFGWRSFRPEEACLVALAAQVTLESSLAGLFSFARLNSAAAYWLAALVLAGAVAARGGSQKLASTTKWISGLAIFRYPRTAALMAALVVPLVLLSFKPVEEIDSINYLHYLIDWMANRATPYTFATHYVAFWELSFVPAWMITKVDLFFPLLALKGVALLALALWLVGCELQLRPPLLLWTVFDCILLRHIWFEHSGVGTLKNDVLHGAGFVLLTLAVLRAARRRLNLVDLVLLAFGLAFAPAKYSGLIVAILAIGAVILLQRRVLRDHPRAAVMAGIALSAFFLLTTGHYYLRSVIQYGNPFFPFAVNLAFLHLPGMADLSSTSILYSLHDARLWRAFFLPAKGISPAGLLFPAILTVALLAGVRACLRAFLSLAARGAKAISSFLTPLDWASIAAAAGWVLYFRSYYSASASSGDLRFVLSSLNTIRYVDGVLAVSEIVFVVLLSRLTRMAVPLVTVNAASRLLILYPQLPADVFPALFTASAAGLTFLFFLGLAFLGLKRRAVASAVAVALCLILGGPFVVERNRKIWTTHWDDLKPALWSVPGPDLVELALPESGWFKGHVVAAGNPVRVAVRSLSLEELAALPAGRRPRYIAVMVDPGSEAEAGWRSHYCTPLADWGYRPRVEGKLGALLERD